MLNLRRQAFPLGRFHRDERGQTAIAVLLVTVGVFVLAGLALDAGLWYFDHRSAQNQVEAAALAAVLELPDASTTTAMQRAADWLAQNNVSQPLVEGSCSSLPSDTAHISFSSTFGNGVYDRVEVCVRRNSLVLLSSLTGITDVRVSAKAAARAGGADGASVMPWAGIPFDRNCDTLGEMCNVDLNANGKVDAGETAVCTFVDCPFGIDNRRLFPLKNGNLNQCNNAYCPSIAIYACGNGTSEYRNCITGDATSSGFVVGQTVTVDTLQGNLGTNTANPLDTWATANGDSAQTCDVSSTPSPTQAGLDTDVISGALQTKLADPACDYRKVVLALICYTANTNCVPPNGSSSLLVVGLAVYYVAGWDNNAGSGTTTKACTHYNGSNPPSGEFDCGAVWGYLLKGEDPAGRFKLDKIGNSSNPLAPIVIALVE